MGSRNLVPGPPNHRRFIVWTALVLGAVALALVVYYIGPRHKGEGEPDSDPRRTFPTPFRNVRPEVQYVGDAVCAGCHADLSASYHEHPMGRSLAAAAVAPVSVREEKAAANPFEAEGFRYSIHRRDRRLFHRMACPAADGNPITDLTEEIAFVVGSGERARSYLVNRDGFVYQSPISWFAVEGRFDLSPGYRGKRIGFSRVIGTDCLFCHSGQVAHVSGTVNGYEPSVFRAHAIGCERCHGPGELHAARQDRPRPGEPDETIVNPARLEHSLAESVCEQCHLQGAARVVRRDRDAFDYRPGLPLDLFMTVFVRSTAPGRHSFVGHVEQMHESRCYRHSPAEKRMTCVSCHDPHRAPAPAEKAAFYRRRCLECHSTQGCNVPVAERERVTAEDSCVACHMPRRRTDDIDHVAITDHRIVRNGKAPPALDPHPAAGRPRQELIAYHRPDETGRGQSDLDRDLGVALAELVVERGPEQRLSAEAALPFLDKAVQERPQDARAWEARARALQALGRLDEAMASIEQAVGRPPDRERALSAAAEIADARGMRDISLSYWDRAIGMNPWSSMYRFRRAQLWSESGDWDRALAECDVVQRRDPNFLEARLLRISYWIRTGDAVRARSEFDTVMSLHPRKPDDIRRWFAEQARGQRR